MCGRFARALSAKQLAEFFDAIAGDDTPPRYNIAPSQDVLAVRKLADDDTRRIERFYWGLVPFWAENPRLGNKLFNARAESLSEKPSFKKPFKRRRCLIPASGFFEWQSKGAHQRKTPYFIHYEDRRPMAFAGLWESWTDRLTGEILESCTIITTEANAFMQPLHHRMPVLIEASAQEDWLNSANSDTGRLSELLVPYAGDDLAAHPVSSDVNSARNDTPELLERRAD